MKRVIFLHGVGGNGASMQPLADTLSLTVPAHCPDGPEPFDMGPGRQWFSVRGVTEENRPARIAAALPAFIRAVRAIGNPRHSLLIGFSQGAIMALHAVAAGLTAAGVIALSGRLAGPVAARDDGPPPPSAARRRRQGDAPPASPAPPKPGERCRSRATPDDLRPPRPRHRQPDPDSHPEHDRRNHDHRSA